MLVLRSDERWSLNDNDALELTLSLDLFSFRVICLLEFWAGLVGLSLESAPIASLLVGASAPFEMERAFEAAGDAGLDGFGGDLGANG